MAADDLAGLGSGTYPAAYAIKGAKVVAAPGKVFEPGTIVVRRGVIEAVGPDKDVAIPYDAETIDGKGLVVYPGFIDLYTTVGQRAGVERSATGRGRPVDVAEAPLIVDPGRQPPGPDPRVRGRQRARADRRAGRAEAAAGFHRPALGARRCHRDRPECPGEPERPAAPRGGRRRAGGAAR